MTFGSLFSGIGGLDLGLERAGMRCRWQSEIDPYASVVLRKHWPEVPNHGDITQIDWSQVETVDLICGGFPCQPHSLAGKRKGSADERNLWPEVVRCLRETGARWFVGENVPGLLSSDNGRMFAGVLGDLAALGFDAVWGSVRASDFGAPHRRERVFLLAYRSGERGRDRRRRIITGAKTMERGGELGYRNTERRRIERGTQGSTGHANERGADLGDATGARLPQPGPHRQRQLPTQDRGWLHDRPQFTGSHGARGTVPDTKLSRLEVSGGQRADAGTERATTERICLPSFPPAPGDAGAWRRILAERPELAPALSQEEAESLLRRMADGFPNPLDSRTGRLKALGNAVVPQVAEFIGRVIMEASPNAQ